VLLSIPLFHTYGGFIQQSAAYLGMRLILLPDPRDTQAMADCIIQQRPFLVPGVPTQFMRLAETGLRRPTPCSSAERRPCLTEVAQHIGIVQTVPCFTKHHCAFL
jgi:acyl-CoA synthetase (AMP-forming)/AMP-acid ligase II